MITTPSGFGIRVLFASYHSLLAASGRHSKLAGVAYLVLLGLQALRSTLSPP